MAADLRALNETVEDCTLVLTFVRGLNDHFKDVGHHIRRGRPFPSYLDAQNELLVEELTFNTAPPPPSALLASTGKAVIAPSVSRPPSTPAAAEAATSGAARRRGSPRYDERSSGANASETPSEPRGGGNDVKSGGATTPPLPPGMVSIMHLRTRAIYMWLGHRPPLAPIPHPVPQQ
ncbi:unnamed protein product [Urochloa humidicola]